MNHCGETYCQKEQHSQHLINYLCLEEQCKGNRLLCQLCLRDCQHSKHSRTNFDPFMEPLCRLSMNYQHLSSSICIDTFHTAIDSIDKNWGQLSQILEEMTAKLKSNLIDHLQTISQTFSENMMTEITMNLKSGKASHDQIQDYVKTINLLGRRDFNDPDKLMEVLGLIQKNINQAIQDLKKKFETLLGDFHNKISKYNLSTNSLDAVIESSKGKQKEPLIFSELYHPEPKKRGKGVSIKEQHKQQIQQIQPQQFFFESGHKDSQSEDMLKMEEETLDSMREMKIGLECEGDTQLRRELKARVKRVVVGYCRNPEKELQKILSLHNVEELEINWYPFAKKEYIIRIMNSLPNLKIWVMNCDNEFDEECSRIVQKKLPKLRRLEYGWDFLNALRDFDENIYFRRSPFTNRGSPLKTSVTREMVVSLKKLQNVWLGDFMYFRPSNNEIPFRNIKEFILGQINGKHFRIPEKLCVQLKDMRQLLSLSILHVRIDERKLHPIFINNPFIKTFLVQGCDDITDQSLKVLAKHCNLIHLSVRESKVIEGSPIWDMHNLSSLILAECDRVRPEEAIAGLPNMNYLTYLNIYGNKWVTNEVVKHIPNRSSFQGLNLGRTEITDQALTYIAHMKQLKSLCLDCGNINGHALAELSCSISQINKLSIWGFNEEAESGSINDDDFEIMAKELVSLHQLSVRFCKKVNPQIFLKFANLRFLQIDRQNLNAQAEQKLASKGVMLVPALSKDIVEEV